MILTILFILIFQFQQPAVEVLSNHEIELAGAGTYMITGKGEVVLKNGKRFLVFDKKLTANIQKGHAFKFPIFLVDKNKKVVWTIAAVSDFPKTSGTTIIDTDHTEDSSIRSTDSITFYLKLTNEGEVTLFQPID